jgi:diguanylate cyclase (GGDEF)-like protein/PAS domain S-box-containing protein
MHKLLKRQLKKTNVDVDKKFLTLVEQAYVDADEDRKLLEHSLKISSEEMRELYEELKKASQKKLRASEERYERLVHELREQYFFYAYDKEFNFTYISDSVTDILGYEKEEVLGANFSNFYTDDTINKISIEASVRQRKGEKSPPRIVSVYNKNGDIHYLEIDSYPVMSKKGLFIEAEGIAKDITQQYTTQKKLDYLSSHDALTGLVNRYSLYNQLEYIIKDSQRNTKNFSLFYIDLDNFKLVNDTFGHAQGDTLLINITNKIQNHIRGNDIFARIGGDEFIIVYTNVNEDAKYDLAKEILQSIDSVLHQSHKNLKVSASIGISCYPKDGEDIDSLLKSADSAMYTIKQNGKGNFSVY